MKSRWFWLALVLLPLLSVRAGSAADAAAWLKTSIAPCFSEDLKRSLKNRETLEKSAVTPKLKKLFARDRAEVERSGEIGRLDFDWVVAGQDTPSSWEVGTPLPDGKNVVVPVVGKWSDGNSVHFFLLEPAGKSWQIADVWYPRAGSLTQILD